MLVPLSAIAPQDFPTKSGIQEVENPTSQIYSEKSFFFCGLDQLANLDEKVRLTWKYLEAK